MQVMTISVANVISLLLFGSWMINAPNYGQAVLLCSSVTKLCSTHCDPMDCSLPGSSVHGIYHARILEWVAISFSKASPWPRDQTHVSCIGKQILYHWATSEAHELGLIRTLGPSIFGKVHQVVLLEPDSSWNHGNFWFLLSPKPMEAGAS